MALSDHIFVKKVSLSAYLFLFLTAVPSLRAADMQWELDKAERQAYKSIIALQMDKASSLLREDSPASAYLQNLKSSITLIITEDPALTEAYEDQFDEHLEFIGSQKTKSPYRKFFMAELHLQHALVNLKIGNEWTAAWGFRRAYKLIEANTLEFPGFLPNYKSRGLLHVMIGSVPEKHHWWLSLLGMQGSVTAGLSELRKISNSDHLFSLEASVIYHLLEAYLLNRTNTAVQNFKAIYQANRNNKLFGYLYMSLLIKNARSADALNIFKHLQTLDLTYLKFNFLNYLAGEIYLQKGDYALAESYFATFIKKTKGRNFTKDAWYKLFLTYWLRGDETGAMAIHKTARLSGQEIVEADKHAAKTLALAHFPNKMIMKIRLATDGGFYERAENLIAKDQILNSKKEKVEFIYRKARLFHKTGDQEQAMAFYEETITSSTGEYWYFAPNSCLQLGYMYRKKNDIDRATYYFKKVLTYSNHEYKTSLDNKAKVALAGMDVEVND